MRLGENFATLSEELPPAKLLLAKCKKQSPDPKKKKHKQRGDWAKSASRGQHMIVVVKSIKTYGKLEQKHPRDGDRECVQAYASEDGAALLGQHSQATGHRNVPHSETC